LNIAQALSERAAAGKPAATCYAHLALVVLGNSSARNGLPESTCCDIAALIEDTLNHGTRDVSLCGSFLEISKTVDTVLDVVDLAALPTAGR